MAQVVEDGTGLPNADSFDSVENVTAYLSATGYATTWASLEAQMKENFVKSATRSISQDFIYPGELLLETQSLALPRKNLYDREGRPITGVPSTAKIATAELAFFMSENNFLEDAELATLESVKVGPISLEISDQARVTKHAPDSVIRMMGYIGAVYRFGRKRMKRIYLG